MRRELWEVKGHSSQENFLSMEKGEGKQAREAHLSGEEVGTHPKTVAADIEQGCTTAKGICIVRIC